MFAVLVAGCTESYVAAVAHESEPSAIGAGSGSGAGETDVAGSGSSGEPCAAPFPLAGCDEAVDPLRAPEIACYDGIAAARFESADVNAWRRAREFGNATWVAGDSEAVLVLSTGTLPEAGLVDEVNVEARAAELGSVNNDNQDSVSSLPEGIVVAPASASAMPYVECDGIGDCSGTLATAFHGAADDLIWFTVDATVPDEAYGYTMRVGLLSAEYPEAVGDAASDLFVWWHESQDYVGNLATWQGEAATVTGLATRMHEFSGEHPMLQRTGMDGRTGAPCDVAGEQVEDCPIGAATGWMQLRGPAVPGETIHLVAALFDQGPRDRDTVVVLDGFTWSCDACVPGESCGLQ